MVRILFLTVGCLICAVISGYDESPVKGEGPTVAETFTTSSSSSYFYSTFPSFPGFRRYWFTTFLAVGLLPLGLATIAFNFLVFKFYVRKRDNILHTMYMMLSVTDIVSGVAAFFQAVTLLLLNTNQDRAINVLVPIVFFLSSLTSHVSAFYSTMLVVIRSINIIWPLTQINRTMVCVAIIVYPTIWCFIVAFEIGSFFWPNDYYDIQIFLSTYYLLVAPNSGSEILIRYVPGILQDFQPLIFVLCTGLPYFLPSVITVICCGVQIHALNNTRARAAGNKSADRNTKITRTILQLTLLFVVCNTAHSITLLTFELTLPDRDLWVWYTLYIVSNILPFLNSLLNPCILITRGKTLRDFVKSTIGVRVLQSGGSTEDNKTVVDLERSRAAESDTRWRRMTTTTIMNRL